jgi:hypothetical protein
VRGRLSIRRARRTARIGGASSHNHSRCLPQRQVASNVIEHQPDLLLQKVVVTRDELSATI